MLNQPRCQRVCCRQSLADPLSQAHFQSAEQPSDHLDPDLGPAACLAVVFLTVLGTEALKVFDGVLQQLESSTDERHQSRLLI